jgi:hypothetical protein
MAKNSVDKRRTVAVIFHETTPPNKFCSYRIWHCAQRWMKWGIDVQFVQGPDARIKADLLIPHIDLSVLPEAYRPLLDSRSMVANRNVRDIRKSTFSRNLVFLHDEYDGPVIVKTDSNHGGKPEKRALRRLPIHKRVASTWQHGTRILRQLASTGSLSKLSYAQALSPAKYPVYPSKHLVPSCAFSNPDLVVERFLPEKEGRFYYIRMYEFLGSEGFAIRVRSEHPVVKGANTPHPEFVPLDESIVALRHALGFDHGKFDYVMHDGKAVLLDVNPTPTFGRCFPEKIREQMWDQLAKGIEQWFPGIAGSSRAELRSLEVSATRAG